MPLSQPILAANRWARNGSESTWGCSQGNSSILLLSLAPLCTTRASESCSEAGDVGVVVEPSVIYPAALSDRDGRSSLRRQSCQKNPLTPLKQRVSAFSASGRPPSGINSSQGTSHMWCMHAELKDTEIFNHGRFKSSL